ncbi:MAG TPA: hypothetical protein VF048_07730 [Gemmatimonadaceae bacterium]|jgi:hypothetical protein
MRSLRLTVLTLLLTTACGREGTAPETGRAARVSADGVTAERVSDGVRLTNGTATEIGYLLVDRGWLALVAPCDVAGPPVCVGLAPGASRVIPESQIGGYSAATREIVVYWWSWVSDGAGGTRPGAPAHQLVLTP